MISKNYTWLFRGLRTLRRSKLKPTSSVKEALSVPRAEELSEKEEPVESHHLKEKWTTAKFQKLISKGPLTSAPVAEDQFQRLREVVTPLYEIPYAKQLSLKEKNFHAVLKELQKKLKDSKAPLAVEGLLPCPVEKIIPSPDFQLYRNMDEFSVNVGIDGNPKTVGFYVGSPRDPNMRCVPPTELSILKEEHKLVAKHFQSFIRNSPHETCLNFNAGAVWKNLVVRSNQKGEVMAIVVIHPSLTPEATEALKQDLAEYFFGGPGAECGLVSLSLQARANSRCSPEEAPYEMIAGKSHLVEECLGQRFRISQDTYFKNNTKATESLISCIRRVSEVSKQTTLLDLYCGTGTIGITLAPFCRSVMAIDPTKSAIADAQLNARINAIRNVDFCCGKLEEILLPLTKDFDANASVVAVVNPSSKNGLHHAVTKAIRQCHTIKKLVYVCTNPTPIAMHSMAMLGSTLKVSNRFWGRPDPEERRRPHKSYGAPFILRYAIPVDMSPQTLHTEHVLLFERFHKDEEFIHQPHSRSATFQSFDSMKKSRFRASKKRSRR